MTGHVRGAMSTTPADSCWSIRQLLRAARIKEPRTDAMADQTALSTISPQALWSQDLALFAVSHSSIRACGSSVPGGDQRVARPAIALTMAVSAHSGPHRWLVSPWGIGGPRSHPPSSPPASPVIIRRDRSRGICDARIVIHCGILPIAQMVRSVSEAAAPVLVVDDKSRAAELRAYFAPGLCPIDAPGERPLAEAISRFRPRLILLNPTLDGLDLPEVCHFLRDIARIPFVFVSPLADLEGVIAGLELGADDYVIKPYNPRELAARVGAVLRRYASDQPASESLYGGNAASSVSTASGVADAHWPREGLENRVPLVARNRWASRTETPRSAHSWR